MSRFSTGLSGFHVLVTGGSKGIGRGIVQTFLAEGANVSYCSRSARGDEFADFEGAADGARAVGSRVDINDPAAIDAWVLASVKEFGKINIVVPNAATGAFEATGEDWQRSFRGDVLGLVSLIESATPHLAKQRGNASIVVMSSLAGVEARHPIVAGPYSTLKRAQITIVKDYNRKLAPLGIRINAIAPGFVQTPNITHPDGTVELSTYNKGMEENPGGWKAILENVPMQRAGEVQEIANAVVFLASNLSGYTTGSCLVIDGGISIGF